MGDTAPPSRTDAAGEHGLFGLRDATPAAQAVALALARAYVVQHDLSDLGMSEADWARLFSLSEG